jgi:small subunit ribosomal protein S6
MSRMVTAPGSAREYETIYILRPDIDADGADKVGQRVNEVVGRESGRLTKVELWGRRRLAYDISKHKRGVYVYLKYLGNGSVVAEVERNLRLSDDVIKYQTVLVRNNVEADLQVNADEVKFERVELTPMEDDREESRERQLGLIEPEKPVRPEGEPEGEMDEMEGAEMAAPEEEES